MRFGPPYVKGDIPICTGIYYQRWKQRNPYYLMKYYLGGAVIESAGVLWHTGFKPMIRDDTLYMCTHYQLHIAHVRSM